MHLANIVGEYDREVVSKQCATVFESITTLVAATGTIMTVVKNSDLLVLVGYFLHAFMPSSFACQALGFHCV